MFEETFMKTLLSRRSAKRTHLVYYLPVLENATEQFVGNIVNISESGLKVRVTRMVSQGETLQMRVLLPRPRFNENEYLICETENVWCRATSGSSEYLAGYRILSMAAHDRQLLETLMSVHSYGVN